MLGAHEGLPLARIAEVALLPGNAALEAFHHVLCLGLDTQGQADVGGCRAGGGTVEGRWCWSGQGETTDRFSWAETKK